MDLSGATKDFRIEVNHFIMTMSPVTMMCVERFTCGRANAISECVRRCVDRWPKTATLPDCGVLAIRVTRENGSHQQEVIRPYRGNSLPPTNIIFNGDTGSSVPTMLHAEIIAVHSSPSMGIAFCQAKDQASNASGKVKAEILRNQLIHQQAKWPLGVFGSSMSWNYPNAKDGKEESVGVRNKKESAGCPTTGHSAGLGGDLFYNIAWLVLSGCQCPIIYDMVSGRHNLILHWFYTKKPPVKTHDC
eukprot:887004-Pelagomonas_calceolata.AAC.1